MSKQLQNRERLSLAESHHARRPRVAMLGLRGVPNVEGGIEKHVEQLALQLVKKGWDVEVFARRRYVKTCKDHRWQDILIRPLWAPASKRLETIVHTTLCIIAVARSRPDLVHIHAIGPALLAPIARLLGLKVIVTHHGCDYDREKWRWLDKLVLRLGEWVGMKAANGRIAVSKGIIQAMQERYKVAVKFVPNAVEIEPEGVDTTALSRFGLEPQKYIIVVGRLVEEKRQTDLVAAFRKMHNPDYKLVLVGGGDLSGPYGLRLKKLASGSENVVLTGTQTGPDLATLYRNARLFALASSHEGMPIAVLEAMSFRLPVIVSDIAANRELALDDDNYFPVGNIRALSTLLERNLRSPTDQSRIRRNIQRIREHFSWSFVSDQTIGLYIDVLNSAKTGKTDSRVHSKIVK